MKNVVLFLICLLIPVSSFSMKANDTKSLNYTFSKDKAIFVCSQISNDAILNSQFENQSSNAIARSKSQRICINEIQKQSYEMDNIFILEKHKLRETCHNIQREYQKEVRNHPDARKINLFVQCLTKLSKI